MADHLTTIYTQAGFHLEEGGWGKDGAIIIPAHDSLNNFIDLSDTSIATNISNIIGQETAQLNDLGFERIPLVGGNMCWICVRFNSAISENYYARIYVFTNLIRMYVWSNNECHDTFEHFVFHETDYLEQLAAAKSYCDGLKKVVAALLPQPIAEEITPEISLSKIHSERALQN